MTSTIQAYLQKLFTNEFRQKVIVEASDTRNEEWEQMTVNLADEAEKIKFSLVDPKKFMKFREGDSDVLQRLNSLENACYCLSQYALNLCHNPAVNDFDMLKTYTGYYTVNILSVMEDEDREVLKHMGYVVDEKCENFDEFVLSKRSQVKNIRKFRCLCGEINRLENRLGNSLPCYV